jgi:hypothetical protein
MQDGDQAVVAAQLERPLRASVDVEWRGCPFDLPVVVRVPPILDEGTPFPTRHWLSCPLAARRIGRLESAGGVRSMERRSRHDTDFGRRLAEAHRRYAEEREAAIPEHAHPRPSGGVGGARAGVKCLHAHYADYRAGNDNPVGELVAPWIEPLNCTVPCVTEMEGRVARNPEWREPA